MASSRRAFFRILTGISLAPAVAGIALAKPQAEGRVWLAGHDGPSGLDGTSGDFHFNASTGEIHERVGDAWVKRGKLSEPKVCLTE